MAAPAAPAALDAADASELAADVAESSPRLITSKTFCSSGEVIPSDFASSMNSSLVVVVAHASCEAASWTVHPSRSRSISNSENPISAICHSWNERSNSAIKSLIAFDTISAASSAL